MAQVRHFGFVFTEHMTVHSGNAFFYQGLFIHENAKCQLKKKMIIMTDGRNNKIYMLGC